MGQFAFDVDEGHGPLLARSLWPSAYLSGVEGIPWHTLANLEGCRLTVRRDVDDSAKLFLPFPVEGHGIAMLGTCSLRPSPRPYPLLLELARGSLYSVRNQADNWSRAGLKLDAEFEGMLDEATQRFLDASGGVTASQSDEAARAIRLLETASHRLSDEYAAQAIAYRKQRDNRIGTLLAGVLPARSQGPSHPDDFVSAFNTASIRMSWGDVESDAGRHDFDGVDGAVDWAIGRGLRVIGGPLLDFHEKMLPHWSYLFEGQFHQLLDAANRYAEMVVKRYKGKVQIWNPISGLNTPGPLRLSEEEVMQLASTLVRTIRRQDPQTPVIFSIDQPYGEYLAHQRDGISPIHFADTLARCGLGLAGIGLEFRIGYSDYGMAPRSSLVIGQMLDRWSTLGLPLLLQMAVPGHMSSDPLATRPSEIISADETGFLFGPAARAAAQTRQLELASAILRVAIAKPSVHAVVWEGWDDTAQHLIPHAGLWDASGPRPLLEYFQRIRQEFLN
jgi:hypothetical protein